MNETRNIFESSREKRWEDYDTIICPDGQIIDMQKLLADQASALAACRHLVPEFGGLVSKLKFKYTFRVETQATDGFSIYINPQFTVNELDTPTKKFAVMLHEVMHCMLNHLRRGAGHNPMKSNEAADYEVNGTLTAMQIVKESTWKEIHALFNKKYDSWGYEKIYDEISVNSKDNMQNQQGQQQAQQNQQDSGSGQDNQDNDQNQSGDSQGSQSRNSNDQQYQDGQNQQGSGSGQPTRDDPDAGPTQNQGKVRPQDCIGPNSLNSVPSNVGGMINKTTGDKISENEGYDKDSGSEDGQAKEWEKEAQKAADEVSKNRGYGAGGEIFAQKINQLTKVTTNWKKALKNIVGKSLSPDEKRRAFANKNVLVSQDRIARTDKDKYDSITTIIALIDTSGSMSNEYKAACLKEIYQVANQRKPCRIAIIPFDDGPRDVIMYTSVQKLYNDILHMKVKLKGGGGTDVKPCFDLLKNDKRFKGQRFELVMIFTDGYLDQVKRDNRICANLAWIIADNPQFTVQNKERHTYRVTLNQNDVTNK